MRNNINLSGISEYVDEIRKDPEMAKARYAVELKWESGTRSTVTTRPMRLGRYHIPRDFQWTVDEPRQLLGLNHGPSPQEYLLSGVGSCILVGYAVGASVMGIQLEHLNVEVSGSLDLRGFLKVEDNAPVQLEKICYRVEISGDGSDEQFEFLHQQVAERSPNRMSIARGVPIEGQLEIVKKSGLASA